MTEHLLKLMQDRDDKYQAYLIADSKVRDECWKQDSIGIMFDSYFLTQLDQRYLYCMGQLLKIGDYPELFRVIGHNYSREGIEEGYFNIPDMGEYTNMAIVARPYIEVSDE